jgi:hypothetical protein
MKKLLITFTFALILFSLGAQVTPYHYSVQAAVSSELVYCVNQDSYGRLLIGTDKGLYRYNGFKSVRVPSTGNYSREISLICVSPRYVFAANRAGQLLQLRNDRLFAVALPDFTGDIKKIDISGGQLAITGSKFITTYSLPDFSFQEQEPIPYTEDPNTNANSIARFGKERYAVLNSGELVQLEDQSSRNIPSSTGKFIVEFAGELIIIPNYAANEPIYSYKGGRFKSWGPLLRKSTSRVMGARVIRNQLFVLTENGVFVYTDRMSRRPAHWFEGTSVFDIFSDAQQNSWICTRGRGILFVPAGRHDIVYPGSLLSIEAGPDNSFFGGLLDGSIARIDFRGRVLNSYGNQGNSGEALFLHYDPVGRLLYSSSGVYSTVRGIILNALPDRIRSVARTAAGGTYVAKSSGIVYLRPDKKQEPAYVLTDSTKFIVLKREPGRAVLVNKSNDEVAFSTVKGVFVRKGEELPQEITFNGQSIDAQSICWFRNDLVIATASNDILLARNGKVIGRLDLSGAIGDLIILKMLASDTHLHLLTEKGMYRLTDLTSKVESLKELVGFDGLVMRDFTLIGDKLFIATQRGVLRFAWSEEQRISFSLVLSGLYGAVHKNPSRPGGRITFPANENLIVIPFECVDLTGNQQFLVQYAIRTGDEKRVWNSLPSSVNQLNLSHLSPGSYTVEFRLLDPVSRTASAIQSRRFVLLGYWYDRPVIWWLVGLIMAFVVTYFWRRSLIVQRRRILQALRDRRRR